MILALCSVLGAHNLVVISIGECREEWSGPVFKAIGLLMISPWFP